MNALLLLAFGLQATIAELHEMAGYLLGTNDGYAGMEYVDLKLPSKTLWATRNLGAQAPEDYGNYFAWGELETKEAFKTSTYQPAYRDALPEGEQQTYPIQQGDGLPYKADAARFQWSAGWEMPTLDQVNELLDNCRWAWTSRNGVTGYLVQSYDFSTSIFLPATGYVDGKGEWQNKDLTATYWTKETPPGTANKGKVYALYFDKSFKSRAFRDPVSGFAIRPVTRSVTARFDLNGDGRVTLADLTKFIEECRKK